MNEEEVIIIGGGPCGLSAAIALKEEGIQALVIEKGNVVDSIYRYPTHQTFFSSSEKLEIKHWPTIGKLSGEKNYGYISSRRLKK